jgi:hypothetical protein
MRLRNGPRPSPSGRVSLLSADYGAGVVKAMPKPSKPKVPSSERSEIGAHGPREDRLAPDTDAEIRMMLARLAVYVVITGRNR